MNSFIGGIVLLIVGILAWSCATKLQKTSPETTKKKQDNQNIISLEGKIIKKDFSLSY